MSLDYVRYADIERYLFEDVHRRFHADGCIGAFDFFSIVIWKANRAKSKVARGLLRNDRPKRRNLEPIVRDLTASLHVAADAQARLGILMGVWKFRLAMATAILTVLWPDEFTVYDVRVCGILGDYERLANRVWSDALWAEYREFVGAVRKAVPVAGLGLRDTDRYLWGKSVAEQLREDIGRRFGH